MANRRDLQRATALHEEGRRLYQCGSLGNFTEVLTLYDQALALDPDNEQIWYDKGNVFRMWERLQLVGEDVRPRHQEAIACYERAVALDPNYADAWGNMGVSYGLSGNHREALRCFNKALEIHPNDQ